MYGKSFESKYTGSMLGAGFNVFAVWDYITTNARSGTIELNPKLLAFTLAGTRSGAEEEVREAIEFLCAVDPESRSRAEDGRRMVKEGEFQYRVVNWEIYQGIRNEEQRREYNRIKQAEYRQNKRRRNVPTVREDMAMRAEREGKAEVAERIMEEGLPVGQ